MSKNQTLPVEFPWTNRLIELASQIAIRLGAELKADAVWLFGSAARGEMSTDSDIDLLVVVPESTEPRYRRAQRAQALVADIRVPKDVIVLTRAEWKQQMKVIASLASTVFREGKLLYGA